MVEGVKRLTGAGVAQKKSIRYGQYPFEHSTLLPPNASSLERRLEQVFAHRLAQIDIAVLRDIKNPAKAPPAVLPWLAWENSVDWWNEAWPTLLKRNWIAKAPEIHMKKGTAKVVEESLEYLGLQAEWIDFWKYDGTAGGFQMKVFRQTQDEAYIGLWDVAQIIDATKCDTRHLSKLTLGVASKEVEIKACAGHGTGITLMAEPYMPSDLTAEISYVSMGVYSELIIKLSSVEFNDVNLYPAIGDH